VEALGIVAVSGVGGAHVWQLEGRARARTRASEQNASCVVRSRILVLA